MPKPADALHQTTPAVPMEILTPQQLAERLQVKPSWIYFDWRDVVAWLERQKNL